MSTVASEAPPLEDRLRRDDKWFLGGGRKAIWAPEWPLWLDRPGFWDPACFYDVAVGPVFTVTFLKPDGCELELEFINRTWAPSHLTQAYYGDGLEVTERRALLPDDALVSDFLISNPGDQPRDLHAVVWTALPRTGTDEGHNVDLFERRDNALLARRKWHDAQGRLHQEVYTAYGVSLPLHSTSVHAAEGAPNHPRWDLTPFRETFDGQLDGATALEGGVPGRPGGMVYAALHVALTVPPGETIRLAAGCAFAEGAEEALDNLEASLGSSDPVQISADNWESWFRSVPEFRCSDAWLETAYWYRWYGLKLNRIDARTPRLPAPCVYEGVNQGWFRHAISYSAQVHMLECKWMHDPELARGALRNFIAHQGENGAFPGCILTGQAEAPTGFYHANWGKAVRELCAAHPDDEFQREAYDALARYADYFQRERDPEGSHLYDVINQAETGQEYMARYLFARADADDWGPFRLKGVDATVYIYELYRALEEMAERLGQDDDRARWAAHADATRDAVRRAMWDPERGFFVDVAPQTEARCPSLAAVGFYPFFTDIATADHLRALTDHLLNPEEFWTSWPVPSTVSSDPSYSATGEWKGKRMSCPWNGRAWLMTNSHVADALARAAQSLDPALSPHAADLIHRTLKMTFLDQDPNRPSSYEYYNPETAQAPVFRGTDDYMHSFLADLILKYVAGVQLSNGRLVVDPLPFELEYFYADRIPAGDHWIRVTWRPDDGLRVFVDGRQAAESRERSRLEVALD